MYVQNDAKPIYIDSDNTIDNMFNGQDITRDDTFKQGYWSDAKVKQDQYSVQIVLKLNKALKKWNKMKQKCSCLNKQQRNINVD